MFAIGIAYIFFGLPGLRFCLCLTYECVRTDQIISQDAALYTIQLRKWKLEATNQRAEQKTSNNQQNTTKKLSIQQHETHQKTRSKLFLHLNVGFANLICVRVTRGNKYRLNTTKWINWFIIVDELLCTTAKVRGCSH